MRGLRLRLERAHRGVERGEELVGDEHLAAGERAHQRRLAGVGVADERDAQLVAARVAAVVLLASGWPRAPRAARRCGRGSCGGRARAPTRRRPCRRCRSLPTAGRLAHARRDVVEPRDLDLQARLAALRVAVEDLDDDAGAVEHLRAGGALEVARLARRELVVDDHDGAPCASGALCARAASRVVVVARREGLVRPRRRLLEARARLGSALGRARGDDPVAAGELRELLELALAEHRGGGERARAAG